MPDKFKVTLVKTFQEFVHLREPWNDLLQSSSGDKAFRSHGWMEAWVRGFEKHNVLRILVVHRVDNEQIVGILPLFQDNRGLGERRWSLMGSGWAGSDYLDALTPTGQEAEEEIQNALASRLVGIAGKEWDTLILSNMPADSTFLARLGVWAGKKKLKSFGGPTSVCPVISLSNGYEAALKEGEPGFVAQITRKRKKIEKEPNSAMEVRSDPEYVEDAYKLYADLHIRRFGDRSEAMGSTAQRRFNRLAMENLAKQGNLRFYLLRMDNEVVAVIWGFEVDNRYYYYQTGFDPQYGNRSVGLVLLLMAMEDCAQRNIDEFDLLHGNESYKFALATQGRYLDGIRIYHHGIAGRLAMALKEGRRLVGSALKGLKRETKAAV